MKFRNTLFAFFLCLLPLTAQAEGLKPFNFDGKYRFYWSGIGFGEMLAHASEEPQKYDFTMIIRTTGLVKVVADHESTTVLSGAGKAHSYETNYRLRKKQKRVKMVFDAKGKLVEHLVEPVQTRPPVPKEEIEAAYDPLSYVMELRRLAYAANQKGESGFVMNVFDGKRLTKGTFALEGKEIIKAGGKDVEAIKVSAKRTLLGGYTDKEKNKIDPNEAPMFIYFSNDDDFRPLKLSMDLSLGTAVMLLQ